MPRIMLESAPAVVGALLAPCLLKHYQALPIAVVSLEEIYQSIYGNKIILDMENRLGFQTYCSRANHISRFKFDLKLVTRLMIALFANRLLWNPCGSTRVDIFDVMVATTNLRIVHFLLDPPAAMYTESLLFGNIPSAVSKESSDEIYTRELSHLRVWCESLIRRFLREIPPSINVKCDFRKLRGCGRKDFSKANEPLQEIVAANKDEQGEEWVSPSWAVYDSNINK
ncbi:hypothetical protein M501DRAFT_1018351 [Patellaria atrata CBS 101060]|uniref:Uncharacterized protein n=1 Tax=Patellaria atrata CBS 101060 TaxID=1346257 RepID=A0A9P4S6A5_9PEZI|nr:hypothetical protein M501DRAFT_1018351 [Patellaria atrata CBS 101060]